MNLERNPCDVRLADAADEWVLWFPGAWSLQGVIVARVAGFVAWIGQPGQVDASTRSWSIPAAQPAFDMIAKGRPSLSLNTAIHSS
jgi:hypothetical protein